MFKANRKPKNTARKKTPNGPLMKRNNKKFVERRFRKTRRSKRPNKRGPKHGNPKVMMEQKLEEMYSEVKRKTPRSKRIELFTTPRRNKERVRKRKISDRRGNSSSKVVERTGSLISVSPNGDNREELNYSADGDVVYKEAATIKNELRGLKSKENVEAFSTSVTTTFDGLKGSEFLTHATTARTEILPQQKIIGKSKELHKSNKESESSESFFKNSTVTSVSLLTNSHSTTTRTEILSQQESSVFSKELHNSNNDSESSDSSFRGTTVIPVILLTNNQDGIMSNKVTLPMNEIGGEDHTVVTTTNTQMTPSWNTRVLEATEVLPLSTAISSDSWIKTQLELQSEEIGSSIVYEQTPILLPNNSVLQVESSGESEVQVELFHENGTQQVTEITHVQSTDSALPYPTGQKDGNITNTVTDGNETRDSVFRPLEMVMNYGSETTYCKPGYKYYAGACKSMCDMGDFYCETGGECVIVENLGAMCRCHQTNNLCYRGECCRLSLTPFQLICVIGSCCIFVSVFLASISLLIRRMDIKEVSKSVRTSRLWISTLMPDSRSSSFSHSVNSELTACSEYDSPDLSRFHRKKEVTYEGDTLKCERTRL